MGDAALEIDPSIFRLQIGFQNHLANFRIAMRQIAAADAIPDYHLQLIHQLPRGARSGHAIVDEVADDFREIGSTHPRGSNGAGDFAAARFFLGHGQQR